MGLSTIKTGGAVLMATINLALLLWALRCARRRQVLPNSFLGLSRFSAAVGAFQVLMGLLFLALSYRARPMHYMYGSLVGLGALAQFVMARSSALGERMRNRGWVHAFVALLIALLALRSWMSV